MEKTIDFCWFILGNGRKAYLERTIASWESNLIEVPKFKIIFDDSGDRKYISWLRKTFGKTFDIVPVGKKQLGQSDAIRFIFDYISKLDVEYVLEVEEDWMLFRPLSIADITMVLDSNPNIVQMRIPRTIWHNSDQSEDLAAGSLLMHFLNIPGSTSKLVNDKWFEWRGEWYFWSHNPNVFKKTICSLLYNSSNADNHEMMFGSQLLENPSATAGWWATNPYEGYVTHIGIRDDQLLELLPRLTKWEKE